MSDAYSPIPHNQQPGHERSSYQPFDRATMSFLGRLSLEAGEELFVTLINMHVPSGDLPALTQKLDRLHGKLFRRHISPGTECLTRRVEATFIEHKLITTFSDQLARMRIEDVMILVEGREVSNPEAYGFVPLVDERCAHSLWGVGHVRPTNKYIHTEDRSGPFLDTRQAIGLAYDQNLIAVAGAGVDSDGRLLIKQLQDVTGIRKTAGKAYYATGLQNGLAWRKTLVTAWETIGREIGSPASVIISHVHNPWEEIKEHGYYAYDAIAQDLEYTQRPNGDWEKPL